MKKQVFIKIFIIVFLFSLTGCTPEPIVGGEIVSLDNAIISIKDKINRIENKIQIGNIEKDIYFSDENSEESFIIKTDEKDYIGIGGDVEAFFSVTNVSNKKQGAKILFSFLEKNHIQYIERFEGNTIVTKNIIIPELNKPVLSEISEPTYVEMVLGGDKIDKTKYNIKDIKGRQQDKWFYDVFNIGETKYYRAIIRIPLGTNNEEWFIEAFGDDLAYSHLDPNLWTYEQTFNSLSDGALSGQDSWTANTNFTIATEGTAYEGAKDIYALGGGKYRQAYRSITGIVSGTVYFSMRRTTNSSGYSSFYLNDGNLIYMEFGAGGNITIYDSTTPTTLQAYSADTWYRIGIAFETGAGAWEGLSADSFKVSVDDGAWSSEYDFYAVQASATKITLNNNSTASYIERYDYISYEYGGATPVVFIDGFSITEF